MFMQSQIGVLVLGYGCIYQGGYVFSLNDDYVAYPVGTSVGGSVAALTDQSAGIIWGSNGNGASAVDASNDLIPGVDEASNSNTSSPAYADFLTYFTTSFPSLTPLPSSSFSSCNGNIDGSCNSNNIMAFYNYIITSIPAYGVTPQNYYAAGVCNQYSADTSGNSPCTTGVCYSGWYLPSICEMGYDTTNDGSTCGVPPSLPLIQNMQTNLVEYNNLNLLAGFYRSSTENAISPPLYAWIQNFASVGSFQGGSILSKDDDTVKLRCVRSLG